MKMHFTHRVIWSDSDNLFYMRNQIVVTFEVSGITVNLSVYFLRRGVYKS